MKTLTIGSRSRSPFKIFSLILRLYMGTPYSHVFISFPSKSLDRTIVYEAVGGGVRFIGLNQWLHHALVTQEYQIDISDENYKKLMQYCIDRSGEPYGFLQNIGILIADIFGLKKNVITRGYNCSELLCEILEQEGTIIDKPKDLVTPKDIELALKSLKINN